MVKEGATELLTDATGLKDATATRFWLFREKVCLSKEGKYNTIPPSLRHVQHTASEKESGSAVTRCRSLI